MNLILRTVLRYEIEFSISIVKRHNKSKTLCQVLPYQVFDTVNQFKKITGNKNWSLLVLFCDCVITFSIREKSFRFLKCLKLLHMVKE